MHSSAAEMISRYDRAVSHVKTEVGAQSAEVILQRWLYQEAQVGISNALVLSATLLTFL